MAVVGADSVVQKLYVGLLEALTVGEVPLPRVIVWSLTSPIVTYESTAAAKPVTPTAHTTKGCITTGKAGGGGGGDISVGGGGEVGDAMMGGPAGGNG